MDRNRLDTFKYILRVLTLLSSIGILIISIFGFVSINKIRCTTISSNWIPTQTICSDFFTAYQIDKFYIDNMQALYSMTILCLIELGLSIIFITSIFEIPTISSAIGVKTNIGLSGLCLLAGLIGLSIAGNLGIIFGSMILSLSIFYVALHFMGDLTSGNLSGETRYLLS